jgi:hypothetical protein
MIGFLKHLFWPIRPRHRQEAVQFFERMDRAKAYGLSQQQESANHRKRASRDLSESMAVQPLWRKQEGGD